MGGESLVVACHKLQKYLEIRLRFVEFAEIENLEKDFFGGNRKGRATAKGGWWGVSRLWWLVNSCKNTWRFVSGCFRGTSGDPRKARKRRARALRD